MDLVVIRRRPQREAEERKVLDYIQSAGEDAKQTTITPYVFPVIAEVHFSHCQAQWQVQEDRQTPYRLLGLVVADSSRHRWQVVGHVAVCEGGANKVKL